MRQVDRAQVARRHQVDVGFAPPSQHVPAYTDIGPSGLRIGREIHRRREIGPAVIAVLQVDGQLGEVGVLPLEDDLLDRRVFRRHLDRLDGME